MLTYHAQTRCQQRGISHSLLVAILEEADIETPVGNNCRLQRVSRRTARARRLDDRVSRFAIIVSDDSQKIVTVLPLHRHAGSKYSNRS